MDKTDRLTAVGIVRQALAPLIKEWTVDQELLAKAILNELTPTLQEVAKALTKSVEVAIPDLDRLIEKLNKLEKNDTITEVKLPDITKLAEKLESLTSSLAKANIGDYRPHDQDDKIAGVEYDGFVAPNGNWYIVRQQDNLQRYASGRENYEDAWQKRDKQNYGYLNKVMT